MSHDPYVLAAMAALILFAVYRRFRRLFGRQLLQPTRLKVRIALLTLITIVMLLGGMHSTNLAAATLVGLAAGAAVAYVGLRLTRFDAMPGGIFYTPNAYIGAALSAVLLGRLVYRFQVLYPTMQAAHAGGNDPLESFQRSPLTLALLGIVIGYYLAYCVGLLLCSAKLRAQPPIGQVGDAASPPSGP
jgi:hypothetical protein